MAKTKQLKIIIGIIVLIGLATLLITEANAQVGRRIATECNATTIESNYSYVSFNQRGYTGYVVSLKAGLCKRAFAGRIETTSNIRNNIEDDINNQINNRNIYFNLTDNDGNTRGTGGHRVP